MQDNKAPVRLEPSRDGPLDVAVIVHVYISSTIVTCFIDVCAPNAAMIAIFPSPGCCLLVGAEQLGCWMGFELRRNC